MGQRPPCGHDARVEIETSRLHLRPFTSADLDVIHAVYADPEVMRYVGNGAHRTMADTKAALRTYADALAARGFSFVAGRRRARGGGGGGAGPPPPPRR